MIGPRPYQPPYRPPYNSLGNAMKCAAANRAAARKHIEGGMYIKAKQEARI